jgi:drug/metabolite transporter (DMT)-like permease
MLAFAGNSLLCRLALKNTAIDAATFTTVRIASGALVLWLLARGRSGLGGSWISALALFGYAIAFSLAYRELSAATGALLLFGAVQASMIAAGLWRGERLHAAQSAGLVLALGGLVVLLLPGLSAPPLIASLLMLGAGVAWGVYSLRGRGAGDPLHTTAGNFVRAAPFALAASLLMFSQFSADTLGVIYAIASGALTSGVGYAIWYAALPRLRAVEAASVQLSVPVLAALGGIALLGETPTLRLIACSAAVLGGIALVIARR